MENIQESKGLVGFTLMAIIMFVLLVMILLFLQLFKFHLSLTVKDTFDFIKGKDAPAGLYNLRTDVSKSPGNGCDKEDGHDGKPPKNCNIPIIFVINTANFIETADMSAVTDKLKEYIDFFKTDYFMSLELDRTICLRNDALESGTGRVGRGPSLSTRCDRFTSFDLGLAYPLPLMPNKDNELLTDLIFQIRG